MMRFLRSLAIGAAFSITALLSSGYPVFAFTLEELSLSISDKIQEDEGLWADAGDKRLLALIDSYESADFAPIWVNDNGASDKARALVLMFKDADKEGLYPNDYSADLLEFALEGQTVHDLAELEIALSYTLLNYAHHVRAGLVSPSAVNRELRIYPEGPDPADVLIRARLATDMDVFAESLPPQTPRYDRLRKAIKDHQAIAETGGWTVVPGPQTGKSLKPGMTDPMVVQLSERLVQSGDMIEGAYDPEAAEYLYDDTLVEAVTAFQSRHGLELDGVVGPNTLLQLNTSVEDRIQQLTLNLERRRWMPESFGETYVFVNLADQYLKVVEDRGDREKTIHEARTVVGKTYHKTPVFSEMMTYLVVNPNWNVPYSIATREYLPKLMRDPGAASKQNIRVLLGGQPVNPYNVNWAAYSRSHFPFRLQQAPGRGNALGQVKFMFPNEYNVYIHDTPSKSLFSRASRAFSHGCVRVENPLDLAEVLLESQNISRANINSMVGSGKRRVVKLEKPIPVHITYLTAWVNKDGSVHFRRDIYERDPILSRALERIQLAAN